MKILIGNFLLRDRTGSELFTLETAAGLRERGHEVGIFCLRRGPVAGAATGAGVRVVTDCGRLPFAPEVLHANMLSVALAFAAAFPQVPLLGHLHGANFWHEEVIVHPSLRRLLAVAPALARNLERAWGLAAGSVGTEFGGVDLRRFRPRAEIPERPRRALFYGRSIAPPRTVAKVRAACARHGIGFTHLSDLGGNLERPEEILPRYDLVFALGRSAREAASCGCAVMPVFSELALPIAAPANLKWLHHTGFSAPGIRGSTSEARIAELLGRYDAAAVRQVSDWVRREYDLERFLDRLEREYAELPGRSLLQPTFRRPPSGVPEYARLVERLKEEKAELQRKKDGQVARWKEKAEAAQAKLDQARAELAERKRPWWKRRG